MYEFSGDCFYPADRCLATAHGGDVSRVWTVDTLVYVRRINWAFSLQCEEN